MVVGGVALRSGWVLAWGVAWARVRGAGGVGLVGWAWLVLVASRAGAPGPWLLGSVRGGGPGGGSVDRAVRWLVVVGFFLVHVPHPFSYFLSAHARS